MNGTPATSEQAVFANDVVRTEADGGAVLSLPGTGALSIAANTEVSFRTDQYIATLRHGSVEVRSSNAGKNVEIEFGRLVMYLPFFEAESAGSVSLTADGTARVECRTGPVAVSAVEGTAVVFLKPGQFVNTAADGRIGQVESPSGISTADGQSGNPTPAGKSHGLYYVIGAAAAAGGGVGIALALQHHNAPVSPTSP